MDILFWAYINNIVWSEEGWDLNCSWYKVFATTETIRLETLVGIEWGFAAIFLL
jgi:hypothetical protein